MNRLGSITIVLIGALMLFMAVLLILDARDASEDPRTYEMVHRISVEEYIEGNYRLAMLFVAGVVLSIMPFLDKKRAIYWQRAVFIAGFVLLVFMIYGFGQWAASGFDH